MGTPRRYLPQMTFDAAQSLTQSESGMTCIAKAAEMIAKFVSEKISDTTAKVSVFFRHSQKPSKIEGVKLVGVDRDGDLSIKVTVQHSRYKIMYFALIQVSGMTGEELQKCLSQEASPVMLHALRSAVDAKRAEEAATHSNGSHQRESVTTSKVVTEKRSSHEQSLKDGLPLEGFMKDETNVALLLDQLHEKGMSDRSVSVKEFYSILKSSMEELVDDIVPHMKIVQTVRILSSRELIKHPQNKPDKWMFGVKAYDTLGKPLPFLLAQTGKKKEKIPGVKNKKTVVNGSLNGSSHAVASTSINLSEVSVSASAESLMRFIQLKELLQKERNRLAYLEEEINEVSKKVESIEVEIDNLGVDPQQLQSRLAELLK